MASISPLSVGATPVGANAAYGIGPSVAATVRAGGAMTNPKARAAAEDFEAVFLNSMFSQMMTGIGGEGPFGGSQATGVWRSFLTNEYSKAFAKSGGIGLAKSVYDSLMAQQEVRSK
ncbi:MAG: flagellar assembly peptidoglycan hydrolase FlgJ [Alphaproteobacteria bacterium]